MAPVILVDANLLVYASASDFDDHSDAKTWLQERLSGRQKVGLPWLSLLTYLRVITHPSIFRRPLLMRDAVQQVRTWLESPVAWVPEATHGHLEILFELLAVPAVHGDLVPDAHLAALAIEHGLTLMSHDRNFARFPSLRWEDPLR